MTQTLLLYQVLIQSYVKDMAKVYEHNSEKYVHTVWFDF